MKKLNICDEQLLNHVLQTQISHVKTLFKDMENGNIRLAYAQTVIDMSKKEIIEIHKKKFKYWQGKNGNYNSYLPKENVKPPYGRLVSKTTQEKLDNAIIDYYLQEKEKSNSVLTFKEVSKKWRELKDLELCDNSILRYNTDYKKFFELSDFEMLPITEITENTIRKFMLEVIKEKNLSRESCKKMFSYIKNTIKYARIEKLIPDNPVEFLELKHFTKHCRQKIKPNEEQFYNDNELKLIQKGLNELYKDKPTYMPRYGVELAILTGMRAGEITALKWEDIHEDYILIHHSVKHNRLTNEYYIDTTKTKKARQFPMCDEIASLFRRVQSIQQKYGYVSEYVFSDENNGFLTSQLISDCAKRLTKYLGIHGGGITALRKTINSNLRKNGVPVTIVASMLGHSPEVNERYYTYDTSNLEEKQKIIKERNANVTSLAS